jgi:hypothetical protein
MLTGTPSEASWRIASSLFAGALALGSILRPSSLSNVAMEMCTRARPFAAIDASMSKSRTTKADFVVTLTGTLH